MVILVLLVLCMALCELAAGPFQALSCSLPYYCIYWILSSIVTASSEKSELVALLFPWCGVSLTFCCFAVYSTMSFVLSLALCFFQFF